MASAVDPRLFDPRDRDVRPEITPQGVQQTYFHGRVISTAGCQSQHHLLSLASGFTPCCRGIK